MTIRFDTLERRILLAVQSDDFNTNVLNAALWTFVNPLGDGSLIMDGTNALLSVPGGRSHDVWGANNAPRLMQPAANDDFEIEVKFESKPAGRYAQQGLIVEADAANYVRFDVHSDGLATRVFAASISNGSPSTRHNSAIAAGFADPILYMRVRREADRWMQHYSFDGATWHKGADFTHNLAVTAAGVFAGNAGGSNAPAFLGSVDYFFNTVSPIVPEDSNWSLDTTPPLVVNVKTQPGSSQVPVTWSTNERATGIVEYGLTDQYELGSVVQPTVGVNHAVVLNLDPYQNYHFRVRAINENGLVTLSRGMMVRSGGPVQASPVIDVWNGSTQTFGQHGQPQRWVNVMGRIYDPDGIAAVSYTLNGGPVREINVGPNGTRLEYAGDFNIELPVSALVDGPNTVVITARDGLGNVSNRVVTVNYAANTTWALPYTADWSAGASVSDVAQVVDGLWNLEVGSVRTVEMGYDRLLAIGDLSWQDYEVTVPVTIHGVNLLGSFGPAGVAIGMRWQGHYGDPWKKSPNVQWWPLGALGWYGNNRLTIYGNNLAVIGNRVTRTLQHDVTYMFKMRVETVPGQTSKYSFKVWQAGTPEPSNWDITGSGVSGELTHGSVLLIAHHMDVTFGAATISALGESPAVISNVVAQPGANQAQVSWTTNKPTTAVVQYGTTQQYELGSVNQPTAGTNHSITLPGLEPGTTYHFRILATDSSGSVTTSQNYTFTTTIPDTAPPVISNVLSQPGTSQAQISWLTDEPATGLVEYGLTDNFELGAIAQPVLGTSHSLTLSGLQPGTTYYFRIVATDTSVNSGSSTVFTFTTTTTALAFVSDHFNSTTLDSALWTFVNPVGDGSVTVNGTHALISVPGKRNHDAWTGGNFTARIMQSAANEDFEIEVKFDSVPSGRYALQGLFVEASPGNYLRFDFHSDGSSLRVFAASVVNDSATSRYNKTISTPSSALLYMRVGRVGNQWTQSFSYDGSTWIAAANFSHTLGVTQVGVFAGNAGGSKAPTFTAAVDYFVNTTQPGDPGDGGDVVVPTTIAVNNPALFFSPDTWVVSGSTYAQAVNTGAYFKTRFTGTSVSLLVDVSMLQMSASEYPTIRYRIDNGEWVRRQMTSTDTSLTLATGLSAGTHELEVWYVATQNGGARWTNPTNVIRITGLNLDSGATVSAPALRPNRALVFGDSITEGWFILGSSGTASWDASQAWAAQLATVDRLNAEIGFVGWNAQGWGKAGTAGVPRFHDPANVANQTWRYIYNGVARDWSNPPDYVLVNMGANDTRTGVAGSTVQAAVADFLAKLRQVAPNTTVYLIVPFGGHDRSWITAGFNDYMSANPGDSNSFLIDIGPEGTSQITMTDSLHPNVSGHAVAAELVWAKITAGPDTTPPVIQNVLTQIGSDQIQISWNNDKPATGLVEYGLTTGYELGSVSSPLGTSHSITISGLEPGATYHFRIVATDESDNVATSQNYTATTTVPDTTPPVIENVASNPGTNQAQISWSTDEPASGVVEYGLTDQYELGSVSSVPGTLHSVTLSGLQPDTTYYFRIVATDGSGNIATSGAFTFTTAAAPSTFVSDEFNSSTLNTALWTFVNPVGDGSVTLNATQALISVPGKRNHDAWNGGNFTARLMQSAADEDFEVEVKFDSVPTGRYAIQGILVEASPGNYLRFDFHSDGSNLRVFAASVVNDSASARYNKTTPIPATPLLYMRVRRVGNQFTQWISYDGSTWLAAANFSHALAVTQVGVFAGNAGGSKAPAFTTVVDYFRNTAEAVASSSSSSAVVATAFSDADEKDDATSDDEVSQLLS